MCTAVTYKTKVLFSVCFNHSITHTVINIKVCKTSFHENIYHF